MRWLVVCLVLFGATDGWALKEVRNPILRNCSYGKTWGAVTTCLAKYGKPVLLRTRQNTRLVKLLDAQDDSDTRHPALVLYVERNGEWKLGGYSIMQADHQLLAFEQITLGKHVGYRIDIGETTPFTVTIDEVSPVPALLRTRRSVFCGGESYRCPDMTTSCEVLVRGKALFAFRGKIAIEDNNILVVNGDRSRAGVACKPSSHEYLGWAQD